VQPRDFGEGVAGADRAPPHWPTASWRRRAASSRHRRGQPSSPLAQPQAQLRLLAGNQRLRGSRRRDGGLDAHPGIPPQASASPPAVSHSSPQSRFVDRRNGEARAGRRRRPRRTAIQLGRRPLQPAGTTSQSPSTNCTKMTSGEPSVKRSRPRSAPRRGERPQTGRVRRPRRRGRGPTRHWPSWSLSPRKPTAEPGRRPNRGSAAAVRSFAPDRHHARFRPCTHSRPDAAHVESRSREASQIGRVSSRKWKAESRERD